MAHKDSISIVLCGEAGQGIQTIEAFLTGLFKSAGYHIFATKEYMSRIRGGSNSTEIRISSRPVAAFTNQIDILIPLDREALPHLQKQITPETKILGEVAKILPSNDIPVIDIPFSKIATEIGNPVFANTVACGVIAGLFTIDPDLLKHRMRQFFGSKSEEIIKQNLEAVSRGYQLGMELQNFGRIAFDISPAKSLQNHIMISGAEAVALGALAGGCNFISSYPMSPGTGVLSYLAQYSRDFTIIVEQAEDEISAINMALGAWYAGARAIVTTSGGGFDLMTEGISLAGMIESPVVIHLGQRPGPATGLPTRTEQADLELVLYAGHGEFPRIILAPGNISEAFYLSQKAFLLADQFQVPVFILTDQFLVDSFCNTPAFDLCNLTVMQQIVETAPDYQRYQITATGVSPRGVPGYGAGLVGVDSDEHDEAGHITEDLDLRVRMNQKRLQKMELLKSTIIPPELIGSPDYRVLIIGWGSTYEATKEALALLNRNDLAFLHFKQVYPLGPEIATYLKKATQIIIVENNATGQLAKLIQLTTGVAIQRQIRKYNGMPFSVEELTAEIQETLTKE
ncbi:MAG TPA: 2-oxoacid:acceptor oxidoreductase subunit alpha [Bacillota bacterium]|nr:2-oxoacid:acceptor oxidoreductase subunit alpha [Bacillota bacterium]